jgi:hypothetical protein
MSHEFYSMKKRRTPFGSRLMASTLIFNLKRLVNRVRCKKPQHRSLHCKKDTSRKESFLRGTNRRGAYHPPRVVQHHQPDSKKIEIAKGTNRRGGAYHPPRVVQHHQADSKKIEIANCTYGASDWGSGYGDPYAPTVGYDGHCY